MKTFKILITAFVVLLLVVGVSNAQDKKTVISGTEPWEGIMPCTDDYVKGMESYIFTIWDGKLQWKYDGTYIGESDKNYTFSDIGNWIWKNYREGKAYNETQVVTGVIKCEGIPIAKVKYRFHVTVNANGEIVVLKESGGDWICL